MSKIVCFVNFQLINWIAFFADKFTFTVQIQTRTSSYIENRNNNYYEFSQNGRSHTIAIKERNKIQHDSNQKQ